MAAQFLSDSTLSWIADHTEDFRKLLGDAADIRREVAEVITSKTTSEKLGNLADVAGEVEDILRIAATVAAIPTTNVSAMPPEVRSALRSQIVSAGVDLSRLEKLLPIIAPLVEQIVEAFADGKITLFEGMALISAFRKAIAGWQSGG